MARSQPVDGFELAYDDHGPGRIPAAVLLHGWPGDRRDHRDLVPLLTDHLRVVVPDLRGFGGSDKHAADPAAQYSAAAQARSVLGLLDELGVDRAVWFGYDVGSRIAQLVAKEHPERVTGLVLAPPLPGIGDRIRDPDPIREFWYQSFHRLPLSEELVDGRPDAVRAYLRHFWTHWSGPAYDVDEAELERLVASYAEPGAFTASIGWYRAGAGSVATALAERPPTRDERVATPTTVFWPEHDPLFPRAWSDRVEEWYADARVVPVDGVGHFAPLEYPALLADAVRESATSR